MAKTSKQQRNNAAKSEAPPPPANWPTTLEGIRNQSALQRLAMSTDVVMTDSVVNLNNVIEEVKRGDRGAELPAKFMAAHMHFTQASIASFVEVVIWGNRQGIMPFGEVQEMLGKKPSKRATLHAVLEEEMKRREQNYEQMLVMSDKYEDLMRRVQAGEVEIVVKTPPASEEGITEESAVDASGAHEDASQRESDTSGNEDDAAEGETAGVAQE